MIHWVWSIFLVQNLPNFDHIQQFSNHGELIQVGVFSRCFDVPHKRLIVYFHRKTIPFLFLPMCAFFVLPFRIFFRFPAVTCEVLHPWACLTPPSPGRVNTKESVSV